MIADLPPGLLLIIGALAVPLITGNLRLAYMPALPLLGIWQLTGLENGTFGNSMIFGFVQTHVRVDNISLIFD